MTVVVKAPIRETTKPKHGTCRNTGRSEEEEEEEYL